MKIFVAASYSSQVDYETGEVFAEYKTWLEDILVTLEDADYQVFCALREDKYRINDADPAAAFKLDMQAIENNDMLLALLTDKVSAGVQTEIGAAVALGKTVLLAHKQEVELAWFNQAIIKAGAAKEVQLPLNVADLS